MLTPSEITDAAARLDSNKLTASDRETLVTVFKLYLKNRSAAFPDLADRLAALTDSAEVKTAAKLAAILIAVEDDGFELAELKGGRSGLQTDQAGKLALKIRFGLTLLGYTPPEDFSGAVENRMENIGGGGADVPSVVLTKKFGW